MTLGDYLKNDKLWQDTKLKKPDAYTDKLLSRSEYLKLVGNDMYSERAYREYKETFLATHPDQ